MVAQLFQNMNFVMDRRVIIYNGAMQQVIEPSAAEREFPRGMIWAPGARNPITQ